MRLEWFIGVMWSGIYLETDIYPMLRICPIFSAGAEMGDQLGGYYNKVRGSGGLSKLVADIWIYPVSRTGSF